MPIERYKSASDMPPPPPRDPQDPSTWAAIRELWAIAAHTLPPLYPPGVTRFRSIEEAQRAREEATLERMRAVRRRRGGA